MSLLAYSLHEDGIVIVTDTLAVDLTGHPLVFTSKCTIAAHLQLAVAGTGIGDFVDEWRDSLNTGVRARDIDSLNRFTPEQLQKLWKSYESPGRSATVYHFGIQDGRCVGYAFRSPQDFVLEPLAVNTFGIKPEPAGSFEAPDSLNDWVTLAHRVRDEQERLPLEERLYIGGQLIATTIVPGEVPVISAREVYRFPDYVDTWNRMADR